MATTPTRPAEQAKKGPLGDTDPRLVIGLVICLCLLGLTLVGYLFNKNQEKTTKEIEQYKAILKLVGDEGPAYLARQQALQDGPEDNRFTAEKLTNNRLQLTTFVAGHAEATSVKVDNYDEDQIALNASKDGGPIITEKLVKLDIRETQLSDLFQMLERIEKSREPVVIRRMNLREIPRKDGFVRAQITISTYIQKPQEG